MEQTLSYAPIASPRSSAISTLPSSCEDRAFARAVLCVLLLAAMRIAFGRTLPMDHNEDYFVDCVRATAGLTMFAASYLFGSRRRWIRLAYILRAVGLGYFFSVGMGPCIKQIYWAGRNFPLADDVLAAFDARLGLDWRTYVETFRAHDKFLMLLWIAYQTIDRTPFAIGLYLAYKVMPGKLYEFVFQQNLCVALVTSFTVFLPALGAFHHFSTHGHSFGFIPGGDLDRIAAPIQALRAGFMDIKPNVSLVQFPSYHAAAGIIYIAAVWQTAMRYPMIILNFLMLLATPIYGCHYFCDMIAGACLAVLSIAMSRVLFDGLPTREHAASIEQP